MERLTKRTSSLFVRVAVFLPVLVMLPLAPARAQDGDAVAMVNGRPISKRRMIEVLWDAHGLPILQQLIVLELAKEQTAARKIRVTPEDVEREFQRALNTIAPEAGGTVSRWTRRRSSRRWIFCCNRRGSRWRSSRSAWSATRTCGSSSNRTCASNDPTLREEFARLYGEKVEIRSIQIGEVSALHEALNLLEKGNGLRRVARR